MHDAKLFATVYGAGPDDDGSLANPAGQLCHIKDKFVPGVSLFGSGLLSPPTTGDTTIQENDKNGMDGKVIDRAINTFRNPGATIDDRYENRIAFDHGKTEGGRNRNTFSYGMIYVRPDAGEARSTDTKSTQLTNNQPFVQALGELTGRHRL